MYLVWLNINLYVFFFCYVGVGEGLDVGGCICYFFIFIVCLKCVGDWRCFNGDVFGYCFYGNGVFVVIIFECVYF